MTVIDDYFKKVEPSKRVELERIRALVMKIIPEAQEKIGYAMPTFTYKGVAFLGIDAHASHIGIYPYGGQVIDELRDQLSNYELSKGAIRVPLDKPIPESLLKQIIKHRLVIIDNQT